MQITKFFSVVWFVLYYYFFFFVLFTEIEQLEEIEINAFNWISVVEFFFDRKKLQTLGYCVSLLLFLLFVCQGEMV